MKQHPIKRLLLSLGLGLVLTVLFAGLTAFLVPGVGVRLFLFPGKLLTPVLGPIIPTYITYVMAPHGGPQAVLALFLVGSFSFWWLLLAVVTFFFLTPREPLSPH
jgi:hypothetical protein